MIQAHTSSLPVFGSVAYTGVHIVTLNQSYDWQFTAATGYDGNMLPNSTTLACGQQLTLHQQLYFLN